MSRWRTQTSFVINFQTVQFFSIGESVNGGCDAFGANLVRPRILQKKLALLPSPFTNVDFSQGMKELHVIFVAWVFRPNPRPIRGRLSKPSPSKAQCSRKLLHVKDTKPTKVGGVENHGPINLALAGCFFVTCSKEASN